MIDEPINYRSTKSPVQVMLPCAPSMGFADVHSVFCLFGQELITQLANMPSSMPSLPGSLLPVSPDDNPRLWSKSRLPSVSETTHQVISQPSTVPYLFRDGGKEVWRQIAQQVIVGHDAVIAIKCYQSMYRTLTHYMYTQQWTYSQG